MIGLRCLSLLQSGRLPAVPAPSASEEAARAVMRFALRMKSMRSSMITLPQCVQRSLISAPQRVISHSFAPQAWFFRIWTLSPRLNSVSICMFSDRLAAARRPQTARRNRRKRLQALSARGVGSAVRFIISHLCKKWNTNRGKDLTLVKKNSGTGGIRTCSSAFG